MKNASEAAKKLAIDFDLDIETIEGSGQDGLVTKQDVQDLIDAKSTTNVMTKQKNMRQLEQEAGNTSLAAVDKVPEKSVLLPSQDDLIKIITEMRSEIENLRESQAGLIEREHNSRDLTDELFFIAKRNGHRWEERRVVDGKTVALEFVGTAFYGPFQNEEDIESYLAAKRLKREDAYIDWENVEVMSGRDARLLDAKEKAEREGNFASSAPVNALDRRIFAQQHSGHVPGVGQVVGQSH